MLHLFNIFHENKDSDNCAQVLEEECIKMFGTKSLNDEHDCNVVSMNSLNICRISGSGGPLWFEHWGARGDFASYLPAPLRHARIKAQGRTAQETQGLY